MLAVVVSDVEVDGEYEFERRLFGSSPEQLRSLAEWLLEQEVEEVVMESTAVTKQSKQKRTARMIRQLRSLGYRIEAPNPQPSQAKRGDFSSQAVLYWQIGAVARRTMS
jgi:hypothetical protein